MTCPTNTCKVGPGKFEGETALTYLAWAHLLCGNGDQEFNFNDRTIVFFKSPLMFDTDDAPKQARAYGFCDACVTRATEEDQYGVAGVSLYLDPDGFVTLRVHDTEEDYDKFLADAQAQEDEWLGESQED